MRWYVIADDSKNSVDFVDADAKRVFSQVSSLGQERLLTKLLTKQQKLD
jgi:hypothetical protein